MVLWVDMSVPLFDEVDVTKYSGNTVHSNQSDSNDKDKQNQFS